MRIAVIGGGGWGLALAKLLAENYHELLVWEFNQNYLNHLKSLHTNPWLLPEVALPAGVSYCGDFRMVADFSPELVILATPLQFLRNTLRAIMLEVGMELWHQPQLSAVVNVAKGMEENTYRTPSQIIADELPDIPPGKVCTLSGPSHAEEVARRIPTTVVVAGSDPSLLKILQDVFSNQYFRVYRSADLTGVEIGGAVKNIIAIAAGIISGLGFGDNTIGALLTRGIVEIQRFGLALGAGADTFLGLSGMGDLITTATSPHSRNRHVGRQIGLGRRLDEVIGEMKMVAEGVATTRSVWQLAQRLKVEMPIVDQVYQVLYQDKNPRSAIIELMTRRLKAE
jgi:glycerol-3-phosphate dehydrogenase (NAD(P)+)